MLGVVFDFCSLNAHSTIIKSCWLYLQNWCRTWLLLTTSTATTMWPPTISYWLIFCSYSSASSLAPHVYFQHNIHSNLKNQVTLCSKFCNVSLFCLQKKLKSVPLPEEPGRPYVTCLLTITSFPLLLVSLPHPFTHPPTRIVFLVPSTGRQDPTLMSLH